MDISQQAAEIADYIRNSWNSIRFERDGEKWSLSSGGESLTGISFSRYSADNPADYRPLAAVDGSSVVIMDAGSFLVGAVRVATVLYGEPTGPAEPDISDMEVIFLSRENYRQVYSREYRDAYGTIPPSVPDSFADIIQRIRSMREMQAALSAMDSLPEGGILLTDGALKADVDTPDDFFSRLADEVSLRKIYLLGVSKRSALSLGHLPLMALLRRKGAELFPDSEWCCYLGDSSLHTDHQLGAIHLARLNRLSDYSFRIDAYPKESLSRDSPVLPILSHYSRDPAYLGYPFPLAQVHNASIIRRSDVEAVAYRIEEAALSGGLSPADWERMFMDFHDVLDRGV